MDGWDLWHEWLQSATAFLAEHRRGPPAPITEHPVAQTPGAWRESRDFRGCPLTFLRYLDELLRASSAESMPFNAMVEEVIISKRVGEVDRAILSQHVRLNWAAWFYYRWFPQANGVVSTWEPADGTLLSFLPSAVEVSLSTRLYSAMVRGLGTSYWSEWAMGRMEWLCLQILVEVYAVLYEDDKALLQDTAALLGCQAGELNLDICWAPHKLSHDGFNMRATACGANDRADFFLVADWPSVTRKRVLLELYHTTNVPKNTHSARTDVVNPETRILATSSLSVLGPLDLAVQRLATKELSVKGLYDGSTVLGVYDNGATTTTAAAPPQPGSPALSAMSALSELSVDWDTLEL